MDDFTKALLTGQEEHIDRHFSPFFHNDELRYLPDYKDGLAWFNANDLGKILGYSNFKSVIQRWVYSYEKIKIDIRNHPDQQRSWNVADCDSPKTQAKLQNLESNNTKYFMIYINEVALYRIAFRAQLPLATEFQYWVANLLTCIRKYGMYIDDWTRDKIEKFGPGAFHVMYDNAMKYMQQVSQLQKPQMYHLIDFNRFPFRPYTNIQEILDNYDRNNGGN